MAIIIIIKQNSKTTTNERTIINGIIILKEKCEKWKNKIVFICPAHRICTSRCRCVWWWFDIHIRSHGNSNGQLWKHETITIQLYVFECTCYHRHNTSIRTLAAIFISAWHSMWQFVLAKHLLISQSFPCFSYHFSYI